MQFATIRKFRCDCLNQITIHLVSEDSGDYYKQCIICAKKSIIDDLKQIKQLEKERKCYENACRENGN